MKTHSLKTWPQYFEAIARGIKTAEFRKDDRLFQAGDTLDLQEYDPDESPPRYTGRSIRMTVSHILRGPAAGIPEGYAMLSLQRPDSLKG